MANKRDRVDQKALQIVLAPLYSQEVEGTDQYGFREGKSVTNLYEKIRKTEKQYNYGIEFDFRKYFDP